MASNLVDGTREKRALTLLVEVCRIRLNVNAEDGRVFGSHFGYVSDEYVDLLERLIPHARDPELRARLADMVWCRKKRGVFYLVWEAIQAYLESSTRTEGRHWPDAYSRIKRALQLAFSVKNEDYKAFVLNFAEKVVIRLDGDDPYIYSASLIELLIGYRHGNFGEFARLAEKLAMRSEPRELFDQARRYWELAAECYRTIDSEKARQAELAAADTYVKDGQCRIDHKFMGCFGVASEFLIRAIEAYNKIEDTERIVLELKQKLRHFQKESRKELMSFDVDPPDLSKAMKLSEDRVANHSLKDAVVALAFINNPNNYDHAISRTREKYASGEFFFFQLMAESFINESGATVARSMDFDHTDPVRFEQAILARTFRDAHYYWGLSVQGCIDPARRRVLLDHYDISWKDFLDLVVNNPFVPTGREIIYARGLFYGLTGDYLLAMHLLIPQIENSIRHLLASAGLESFKIVKNKVQDERGLTVTLVEEPYAGTLEKCLGKDMLFDLRALLVDRHGLNFRNEMAHGLMGYGSFYTYGACYLWWLTLRLCVLPVSGKRRPENSLSDDEDLDSSTAKA